MRFGPVTISLVLIQRSQGDPCSDLDRRLQLGAGSYSKGDCCHGLFWKVSRGSGPICHHSASTKDACPSNHRVLIDEAKHKLGLLQPQNEHKTTEVPTTRKPDTVFRTLEASEADTTKKLKPTKQMKSSALLTSTSSPVSETRQMQNGWKLPDGPITLDPLIKNHPGPMELLILGDIGHANSLLKKTLRNARRKVGATADSAIILGDNFYPRGLVSGISDPQIKAVLEDLLMKELPGLSFHAVLGNHDWMGNADAQLEYSSMNPRWIMPYYFFNRRFITSDGAVTCIWFLETGSIDGRDTDALDPSIQLRWLDTTLGQEGCTWKIVVGHRPIYDAGEYHDNKQMITALKDRFARHGVHLYISGHDHQTEVLYNETVSPTRYIITGLTSERREKIQKKDHPLYVWSDVMNLAFVHLSISRDHLVYRVHAATDESSLDPLYEGTI
jgi:tartrate-resistant acid phosphatase type 5